MSFGTGPFGYFEAGSAYTLPAAEERADLSSSRKINARGQYEVASDGGVTGMDDLAQTVLLTVAYAATRPKFLTQQAMDADRTAIVTALNGLQKAKANLIEIKSVVVTGKAGAMQREITYRNLQTNTTQTLVQS